MKRLDGNNFIFDPKRCLKVCNKHFKINQYNSVAELAQADKAGLLQAFGALRFENSKHLRRISSEIDLKNRKPAKKT